MQKNAIILANGMLNSDYAKTSHGLIRGSERYKILGVVDPVLKGKDAGEITDGVARNIPVFELVEEALDSFPNQIDVAVIGVATKGGIIPADLMISVKSAITHGLGVVSGLHEYLTDNEELVSLAKKHEVMLTDVRKPKPVKELHFWTGEIYKINIPVIAVIGTDCALGKRTTTTFLRDKTRKSGLKAEMIYTGQTGWMQGNKYGFILDSTINDFVSGELEHAILSCYEKEKPDVIFIEGQAAMLNPSGPCGSEFIISGNARGIILQHAPSRKNYKGWEHLQVEMPMIEKNIALIEAYGAEVLGICLNSGGSDLSALRNYQEKLQQKLGIPVVLPLEDGVEALIPVIKNHKSKF